MSAKKFYLTTPIYYVNARPHIGHAYTTIVADVLARRHRLLGEEVYFLTGTDEHGQKIERSAAAAGVPPQQFADEVAASFQKLWNRMGITYEQFIRTTSPQHAKGVQKLFRTLYEKGHIYLASYTGSYCVSDEAFVDAPVGTPCPDCGRLLEEVTEENFFFKLSAFQERLIALIESKQLTIAPDSSRNEVLSFLRGNVPEAITDGLNQVHNEGGTLTEGYAALPALQQGRLKELSPGYFYVPGALKDLSISRSSFTWGIPVPEPAASTAAQKHVIYVWLDALANYMTALGYGSEDESLWHKFWPADVHLVGKEITRFHCVYWPAFLLAAELPLPKQVTAHGWLLFDNAKMSKSKGNIVRTETILDAFGDEVYGKQFPESTKAERDLFASDVLRYFLLREIPFGQDGSFSFEALITRYNADLANGYGNLVSRTLAMIEKFFDGIVPEFPIELYKGGHTADLNEIVEFPAWLATIAWHLNHRVENNFFSEYLETISKIIKKADGILTGHAPWKLATQYDEHSQMRLKAVLSAAAQAIRIVTVALFPVIPDAADKVWDQLGLKNPTGGRDEKNLKTLEWTLHQDGTKLGPLGPIFPRADKGLTQIMTDMEDAQDAKLAGPKLATPKEPASTDPAAPPRSGTVAGATLPVGGSSAHTTGPDGTPSHTEAQASGIFAQQPAAAEQEAATQTIGIDDFAKIDLRVAQIVVAERIPKADKLLRLEVDLGPMGKRQILSGIAEWYTPEELVGRRIVVIANLAPRKMRGLESHGMLLAASEGEHGKPALATCGEEIALGARLK